MEIDGFFFFFFDNSGGKLLKGGREMLFTMSDGIVQRVSYPEVTGRSRVGTDGYAFMCWCALPNADAARWRALAKYDWILEQCGRRGKSKARPVLEKF